MAVCSLQDQWIIRRDFVEIPACRKDRRRPESLDPPASGNPLAGLCLIDSCFDLREEILKVGDAFQVQRHLAKADSGQMVMRVSHSRQYRRTVQIYNSRVRALILLRLGVRTDEDNPIALYRDCVRL